MTPAYINSVKGKLEAMKNSGELSLALVNPTRASIRDECERLYPMRSSQKDKEILADFFKHDKADGTLLETIVRVDTESLKALQNFLTGETNRPNYRVVEMVAWLIDFEPRPYSDRVDYSIIASELPGPNPISNQKKLGEPKPIILSEPSEVDNTTDDESGKPEWPRKIIAIVMLVVIAGLTVFAILKSGKKSGECMYWAEDHYEACSCIQRGGDTIVIPVDPNRLRNFKKITNTKLITRASVGKVWYRKQDGSFEFYTSGGYHPIDIKINLRRLTDRSFDEFERGQTP